jgi:predicted ATPase/DNA-binding SARP family transcriptional activator
VSGEELALVDVRVLGPFEVIEGGRVLALGGRKQRAVLAMLALDVGQVVSRDRLIDGIWGESATDTAVATLQVYVSMLRKVIGPGRDGGPALVSRAPGYLLDLDPDAVDSRRFERLVTQARKHLADDRHEAAARGLTEALDLWHGTPLADLPAGEFAGPELARLQELRLGAVEDRIESELACGRHVGAVPELETLVGAHPYRERLWGQLMVALYRSGLQMDALAAYAKARQSLVDDFGVEPGPELRDLERRILNHDPMLAPPPGAPRAIVKLPAPAHPMLGRAGDLAAVVAALGTEVRLLTVTGPGGMGKTSLALQVAAELVDAYPGGVYFVPLAGVTNHEQVPPAVAQALEVTQQPDEPLARSISVSLGDLPTLVVLDNLEQVLDSGRFVAELLECSPALSVVATSRAPLRVRAEQEYSLGPLTLPEPDDAGSMFSLAAIEESAAVQVFLARAREVRPDFALTAATSATVAEICRRLDGQPLALELAAARVATLDPVALLGRLDRQLGLLTSGPRDLPDRQRTLRSTLDWSHALLAEDERTLLARLGSAAGDLSLETVEALAGDLDAMTGLTALIDNNLVRRVERDGTLRYRLLSSVREYAAERLAESGEEEQVRAILGARLLAGLETEAGRMDRPEAPGALARVEHEYVDLLAAMSWALERGDVATSARFATSLRLFWLIRGRLEEGRSWLRTILARSAPDDPWVARLLLAIGSFSYYLDDAADASLALESRLEAARAAGDIDAQTVGLSFLGAVVLSAGNRDQATAFADEALALAEVHDLYEPRALALSLAAVLAASQQQLGRERELYRQRLELARGRGDRRRVAETLNNLAELCLAEDDVASARTYADDALDLARSVARIVTRDVLITHGRIALADADAGSATQRFVEALRLSLELGQEFELGQCLLGLAGVAGLAEDHGRAARLYGGAARLRGGAAPLDVELEPDIAAQRLHTRQALGDVAYDSAFSAGATMDRGAATTFALAGALG